MTLIRSLSDFRLPAFASLRCLAIALLALGGVSLSTPVQAWESPAFDRNADAVVKHLMTLDVLAGHRISESPVPWEAGVTRIQMGPENAENVSAVIFARDGALTGLRFEIPLLPSADPGLYAFADIAPLLEPALKTIDHDDGLDARESVKRWAGELGLESWMRPRFGAYRIERRVGDTLFVFEGVPLNRFWVSMTPVVADAHPVIDDLMPYIPATHRADAAPVLTAIERGEYKLADRLATPHADAGAPWALLIHADYGRPSGTRQEMSAAINSMLEQSAEAGFVPAQYVLGRPESGVAERWLARAAAAGYPHAIALQASRLYSTGRADDPGARCDELAALQGNAMAQLRTVYRYAEGGGAPDTAYFWAQVAIRTFGESASFTAERYILNTLAVLRGRVDVARRSTMDADATEWAPSTFENLRERYAAYDCF